MSIDVRTLMFMLMLSNLLLWVLLRLATPRFSSVPGMRDWMMLYPWQLAGWLLLALRGVIPEWVSVVPGNLALFISTLLTYRSLRAFVGRPLPPYWLSTLAALFLVFFGSAYLLGASTSARAALASFGYGTVEALCGMLLMRSTTFRRGPACWTAGAWFLLCGIILYVRVAWIILVPDPGYQLMNQSTPHLITFVAAHMTILGTSFGYSLLIKERADEEINRLIRLDDLTHVFNRRGLFEHLRRDLARNSQSPGAGLGLLMVDVDHFKTINDRHGHSTGDVVLRELCTRLQSNLRPHDVLGRYGGEEFGVILPDTSLGDTLLVAERLRAAMDSQPVLGGQVTVACTISVGYTHLAPQTSCTEEQLFSEADQALYAAKMAGRNRVVWYVATTTTDWDARPDLGKVAAS